MTIFSSFNNPNKNTDLAPHRTGLIIELSGDESGWWSDGLSQIIVRSDYCVSHKGLLPTGSLVVNQVSCQSTGKPTVDRVKHAEGPIDNESWCDSFWFGGWNRFSASVDSHWSLTLIGPWIETTSDTMTPTRLNRTWLCWTKRKDPQETDIRNQNARNQPISEVL